MDLPVVLYSKTYIHNDITIVKKGLITRMKKYIKRYYTFLFHFFSHHKYQLGQGLAVLLVKVCISKQITKSKKIRC